MSKPASYDEKHPDLEQNSASDEKHGADELIVEELGAGAAASEKGIIGRVRIVFI